MVTWSNLIGIALSPASYTLETLNAVRAGFFVLHARRLILVGEQSEEVTGTPATGIRSRRPGQWRGVLKATLAKCSFLFALLRNLQEPKRDTFRRSMLTPCNRYNRFP